jgi:hypothetical protein
VTCACPPAPSPWATSVTESAPDGTERCSVIEHRSADRVTLTFQAGGETREASCWIDDYPQRMADGTFGQYLSGRLRPKLARDWRPGFTEVARSVCHHSLPYGGPAGEAA